MALKMSTKAMPPMHITTITSGVIYLTACIVLAFAFFDQIINSYEHSQEEQAANNYDCDLRSIEITEKSFQDG
jgi:hypothetical protein